MLKLTKAEKDQREELASGLEAAWKDIERAGEDVEAAIAKYNDAIDSYNERVTEVNDWRDEQVTAMQDFFDEKSEKWQQGDKGDMYQNWVSEWENFGLDELSHIDVEYVDEPDHADALRELSEEPG